MIEIPSPMLSMTSRNQSLDVLRGVAILLVLGHHSEYYQAWRRGGWIGVDLFFVLSGFLISGLLFKEYLATGNIDFSRFFVRRGFKIYPVYFGLILITMPLVWPYLRWFDFLFMQSYYHSVWGHCWSLSVEEHFYVLLPIMFLLSIRVARNSNFAWIPWSAPVVVVACLIMRVKMGPHDAPLYALTRTHLRFDSLFSGVALGWYYWFKPQQFARLCSHWLPVISIILVGWRFLWDEPPYWKTTIGFTLNIIGFVLLVAWAMNNTTLKHLKVVAAIGRYSYSIYVWHVLVYFILAQLMGNNLLSFWLYLATALAVGCVMSILVEIPSLKLREALFPPPTRRTQIPGVRALIRVEGARPACQ